MGQWAICNVRIRSHILCDIFFFLLSLSFRFSYLFAFFFSALLQLIDDVTDTIFFLSYVRMCVCLPVHCAPFCISVMFGAAEKKKWIEIGRSVGNCCLSTMEERNKKINKFGEEKKIRIRINWPINFLYIYKLRSNTVCPTCISYKSHFLCNFSMKFKMHIACVSLDS